jgi:CRISPR/Cas system-associated exonuclease Cas4 (RecB family)
LKYGELSALINEHRASSEYIHFSFSAQGLCSHWDSSTDAIKLIEEQVGLRLNGDKGAIEFSWNCWLNYYNNFRKYLTNSDEIELKFKIPWDKDVFIVGKMDRISNGKVFDWKTDRKPQKNISKSIQFILYNWAYKKLYKANPSGVYYAALTTGDLVRYSVDEASDRTLFEEIIPDAIRAIKNKEFTRNGIFRGACYRCFYSDSCLKEFHHVMDYTNTTKK